MEYSSTQRGNRVLIYCGFEYIYFRTTNGVLTWRCRQHRITKCHSIIKTKDDNIINQPMQHCHESCPQKIECNVAKRKMQDAMTSIGATPRNVMGSILLEVSSEALAYMPKQSSISRNLLNLRRGGQLPVPKDTNFEIADKYTELVLHDSGASDPDRILVLGDIYLLRELNKDTIFGDGTFDTVPSIFYQLYTWHAQLGNSYLPCIYFLLKKKNGDTYKKMFEILKNLLSNLAPKKIFMDFEKEAMNAARIAFPQTDIRGCYFHLAQSIIRKISSVGLKTTFENNLDIKLKLKSLAALSFVPASDVRSVFNQLAATYPEEESYSEILTYFFGTYIAGAAGRNPLFAIELWNHYDSALKKSPNTTNCCEEFHNALNSLFHCSHPSIWFLIDGLQRDIACHRLTLANAEVGRTEIKNKKYQKLSDSVSTIMQQYNTTEDKILYLRKLANLK